MVAESWQGCMDTGRRSCGPFCSAQWKSDYAPARAIVRDPLIACMNCEASSEAQPRQTLIVAQQGFAEHRAIAKPMHECKQVCMLWGRFLGGKGRRDTGEETE